MTPGLASDAFSAVKHRFPSPDGREIPSEAFLAAAEEVPSIIGTLGTVFAPVKYDVAGNVKKLKQKHSENPEKFATLFAMVEDEGHDPEAFATISLLWLKRGLEMFRGMMLELMHSYDAEDENESLVARFRAVYQKCLEPYHNWITRKLFVGGLHAIPYRRTITTYLRDAHLSPNEAPMDDKAFFSNLKTYIDEMSRPLDVIIAFFEEKGLNSGVQV